MLAIERRKEIVRILKAEMRVVVADLSRLFEVTEETIRRDLEKLEKEGIATKTYGGAVLNEDMNKDLPYTIRKQANVEKKEVIARLAEQLVEDGERIMLDASSTAVTIAKGLKSKKNLTIITNSVEILIELVDVKGWKVYSTGGSLKEGNLALVGHQTEQMIELFHVDKAFVSCKGMDLKKGCTDSNEEDAFLKKMMLESAVTKILAVDSTKWNKTSFVRSCEWSGIDLILTDEEPTEEWKTMAEAMDIEIYYE